MVQFPSTGAPAPYSPTPRAFSRASIRVHPGLAPIDTLIWLRPSLTICPTVPRTGFVTSAVEQPGERISLRVGSRAAVRVHLTPAPGFDMTPLQWRRFRE